MKCEEKYMKISLMRASFVLVIFIAVLVLGVTQAPRIAQPMHYERHVLPLSLESIRLRDGIW